MAGYIPKPPVVTGLDRGKSISYGVCGAWPLGESYNQADAIDYSGFGNNGTPSASVVLGKSPWGYSRNLPTGHHIDMGDSDKFSFGDGTTDTPYTFFVLAKSDRAPDYAFIAKDATSNREYAFRTVSSKLHAFNLDNSAGAYIGRRDTTTNLVADTWYSLAVTYDGSGANSGFKIFNNGVRVDDADYSGGAYTAMENKGGALYIGKQAIGGTSLGGDIANAVIWNRELSADEIRMLYHDPFCMYSRPSKISEWIAGALGGGSSLAWLRNRINSSLLTR